MCLLIEMVELGQFTAVFKPNKRPVNVFLCLQAACIDILILVGFEVAAFGYLSLTNTSMRMRVLLFCSISRCLKLIND